MQSHIHPFFLLVLCMSLAAVPPISNASDNSNVIIDSFERVDFTQPFYKSIICGADIGNLEKNALAFTLIENTIYAQEQVKFIPFRTTINYSTGGARQTLVQKGFDVMAMGPATPSNLDPNLSGCRVEEVKIENMKCLNSKQVNSLLNELCSGVRF
jgi:hypothetical protein